MKLLVSMGVRPDPRAPLRARVVEVDADAHAILRTLDLPFEGRWHSGPGADDEATRPVMHDGLLIQPTHTAVHVVNPRTLRVERTISSPQMHNLHSVWPDGQRWLLTAARRDALLWLDPAGGEVSVRPLDPGAFMPADGPTDHRALPHDHHQPHEHHPNCAWVFGGQLWATCFEKRAALELDGPGRIDFDQIPHDGAPQEGALWFTLVDGRVVAHDPLTLRRTCTLDLRTLLGQPGLLGWCRGVAVVGHRVFVGFTQLRPTRHRQVLRWLASAGRDRQLPTRVVEVDLRTGQLVAETVLAASGTIYGITPVD